MSITLNNLCKFYGQTAAVDGLSLTVNDGDFVNVMGQSGCGKTTLLKCIAGLLCADCGEIYFDDEIVNNVETRQRHVAYVSQEFSLFPNMTVFENVLFALKKVKGSYDEKCNTVWKILDKTGLSGIQNAFPKELSYGQRQKTAIARALVKNPSVVLFDEPLSNVDALSKAEYKNIILQTKQAFGGSIFLYVTHNAADARTLGNKTLVMSCGKALQFGDTAEVFAFPSCAEAAQILWENAQTTTLSHINGGYVLDDGDELPALPPFVRAALPTDGAPLQLVTCGGRVAVFDNDGKALCKHTLAVPCVVSDHAFTVGVEVYDLGELALGVVHTGNCNALCDVLNIDVRTPSADRFADKIVLSATVLAFDKEYVLCRCLDQKILVRMQKFVTANVQNIGNNDPVELVVPVVKLKFLTEHGDVAIADYKVYPNVAVAKVLSRAKRIVSVGGVKLTLPFDVGSGKTVTLRFAPDAFAFTTDKQLRVDNLLNVHKGNSTAVVFANVRGFDKYVTAVVPSFRYADRMYLSVDVSKIDLL